MGLTAGEINILIRARDQASKVLGRVGNAADKMRKVVRRAGMVGAVALAGLAVAVAATFISFDSAMTKSIAIMGDLDDAMVETMEVTARDVAKTTTFSMTQAADSYFFLASAGLSAEQSIGALPKVAAFAQAGMFDMALATDLLTDAQSALGLTVDDTAQNIENMVRVSDVLVKANTLANATVEQFSTALTRDAGAALKSFKIDVEEGVAVLAAFADQGVKGELAGAGLSRILRIMTSAAVANADAYARLGVEVFDATGNISNLADIIADLEGALGNLTDAQRVAALEALGFTARIQGVILPLLGTSEAIREYDSALRDAAGTTAEVAEKQLQSLGAQLSLLRSGFEDVLFTIGQEMEPGLRALVATLREDVIPAIESFLPAALDKAEQLFRDFQPVIEATAGAFRTFVEFILTNKVALIAALTAIGVAMALAFPHVAIAAAAVAIVASLKLLSAEMDDLGEAALRTRLKMLEMQEGFLDAFLDLTTLFTRDLPLIGPAIDKVLDHTSKAKEKLNEINKEITDLQGQLDGIDASRAARELAEAGAAAENLVQRFILATRAAVIMGDAMRAFTERGLSAAQITARLSVIAEQLRTQWEKLGGTMREVVEDALAPPPGGGPGPGTALGEAIGDNIIDGIEIAFLDRPAVGPEELKRIMEFMLAADFTTIGDQLAFVQALADQAAAAFGNAMQAAAQFAGVGVGELELRFGLRDEMQELNAVVRTLADALNMTEAAVLALLSPARELTEVVEEQAEPWTNAAREALGYVSAFELIDQAFAEYRRQQAALIPDINEITSAFSSFFGLTQEQVEDLLRTFPQFGDAMGDAFSRGIEDLRDMLKFWGLTKDAIDLVIEGLDAERERIEAVTDSLSEQQGLWREVRRLINQGVLTDPDVIQEILRQGGIGAPPPALPVGMGPGLEMAAPLLGAGTPAPLLAGGAGAPNITQNITVIVQDPSPAAVARAVEQGGLELGEQLIAEGV